MGEGSTSELSPLVAMETYWMIFNLGPRLLRSAMGEGRVPQKLNLKPTLTIFFENIREFHKRTYPTNTK
jgi:hypothetical protein